jgi:hypothetical protein
MGYKGEQCSGGRTLLRTHGEKLQLARGISTKSRSSSVALRQIRTIGYQGELWRRNGGESGSQTHDFRSFRVEQLSLTSRSIPPGVGSEPGSIPVGANCGVHRRAADGSLLFYFCQLTTRHPAGICAGIGSNRRQNWFQTQMVMALGNYRPGAPSSLPQDIPILMRRRNLEGETSVPAPDFSSYRQSKY